MARDNADNGVVYVPVDQLEESRDRGPDTESVRRAAATMETMSGTDQVGDGYILVHREDKGTSEHCAKVPADKYEYHDLLEWIRDEFGPGDYRLKLYLRGPKNRFVIAENKLETLRAPRTTERPATSTTLAALPGIDPALMRVLEKQQEALDKLAARTEAQGQIDVTKIINTISGVATAVTPLLALFVGKRQDNVSELARLIAITRDVRELTGDAPAVESGGGNGVADMLGAVLKGIAQGMAQRPVMVAPAQLPPPAPAQVGGVPPVAAVQAPAPTAPGVDVSLFAAQADLLIDACRANPSPEGAEQAAAMVCQQIPAGMEAGILDTLDNATFMPSLLRARPELLDIVDWLVYMRDAMATILESKTHATSDNNPAGDS